MSVTSPVTGRVTGIVTSGVTRAIGHRTRATGPALLTGDRYISPTGDDTADGLTRETAWATPEKLIDWANSQITGAHTAVITAGTYVVDFTFRVRNSNGVTITFEFESNTVIDATDNVEGYSGISVRDSTSSYFVFNLRGAVFKGNAVSSANGIDSSGNQHFLINGAAADGIKAVFDFYDDGVSCHGISGAADKMTFNDCRFTNSNKAALAHVSSAKATHNRCLFEPRSDTILGFGGQITETDATGSIFNDCEFIPAVAGQSLRLFKCTLNRCKLGTPSISLQISGSSPASPKNEIQSSLSNCYINATSRTMWMSGGILFRCFGSLNMTTQTQTGAIEVVLNNCIFLGRNFVSRLVDGINPVHATNCIIKDAPNQIGQSFNASNVTDWTTNGSFIDFCNTNGSAVLAGIADTVTNGQTTDPLIAPGTSMNQADWAVQTGSPCIGAGTAGGNIGFTLADIA